MIVVLLAGGAGAQSLRPGASSADADRTFDYGYRSYESPTSSTGHWDADSIPDLLLCGPNEFSCSLFLGGSTNRTAEPDAQISYRTASYAQGGAFVGDLDGDGFDDIAVSAPQDPGGAPSGWGGSVYLFLTGAGGHGSVMSVTSADARIMSQNDTDALGMAVGAAGDVNGDGYDDFWVTRGVAPSALMLFLGQSAWPATLNASLAAATFEFAFGNATLWFPMTIFGGHDINEDGDLDVALAAPHATRLPFYENGAVYVLLGPLPTDGGTVNGTENSLSLWGKSNAEHLGSSVGFSSSFAADGRPLLMVGDPTPASGGPVILAFDPTNWVCCGEISESDRFGRLIGSSGTGRYVGEAFDVGADFDGDGLDDLVTSSPGAYNFAGNGTGIVYLSYGGWFGGGEATLPASTVLVEAAGGEYSFGLSLLLADFMGDARADLLAGGRHGTISPIARHWGFAGRAANRAPTVALEVVGEVAEGSQVKVVANATDADGDPMTFNWTYGKGSSVATAFGVTLLTLDLLDDGPFPVSVEVSDGQYAATASLDLPVANLPPSCTIVPREPFVEGSRGYVQLVVADAGTLDPWTAVWTGPIGFGAVDDLGTYSPSDGGDFEVSVVVTDNGGASGSCTLTVPVGNLPPTITVSGPSRLWEGEVGYFLALGDDPGLFDSVLFSWELPAGEAHRVAQGVNWSTSAPGTYVLTVTASDKDGASVNQSLTVQVVNRPLGVLLDMPSAIDEGEPALLQILQASGSEYDPLTVYWSVCVPGTANGSRFFVARAPAGTFCVNITVTDDDGDRATFDDVLRVRNRGPVESAHFAGGHAPAFDEGEFVEVDAVVGAWESSAHVDYEWLVDGTLLADNTRLSLRAVAGSHTVTLVARDGQGGTSTFDLPFTVTNFEPTVTIEGPSSLQAGEAGTFGAHAADASGLAPSLRWDINGAVAGAGPAFDWSWSEAGTYVVRVTANDGHGGSASASLTVTVYASTATTPTADYSGVFVEVGAIAAVALVLARFRWSRREQD